jgi:polysaccharide pyruvyl transferase WcaK-like protein
MQHKPNRIALLHHIGCGNLGDDGVVDIVVRAIRERRENAEIIILTMNPEDSAQRHGIRCYPMRRYQWDISTITAQGRLASSKRGRFPNWIRNTLNPLLRGLSAVWNEAAFVVHSFRLLRSFDLLIVSGGGQLTERGGPWSFPYALYIWTLIARLSGVRCVFLSVGAGPLNHPLSKFLVTRALRRAEYVSFRDERSQRLVADLGFSGPSSVFPDNFYSFEISSTARQLNDSTPPIVGINPMPYPFGDLLKRPDHPQALQDELIGKLASFTALLVRSSFAPQFFASDVYSDPLEIERMRQTLLERDGINLPQYAPPHSAEQLLAQMSKMDYIVTCRFHGVVFAHLLNKPVLVVAHHPKVAHLMGVLGLSDYCVDMSGFDPVDLAARFRSLVDNREAVKQQMAIKLAEYRAKSAAQFDALFSRGGLSASLPGAKGVRKMEPRSPERVQFDG